MRIRVDAGLEAGRNRCQFLLTLPIAIAVGGLYGAQLAEERTLSRLVGICVGAVGLPTFVYVQLILEPLVVGFFADDTGRFDTAIAFVWDAAIGAVVGLPLFWLLGVAPLPALAAAAGVGFAYGWVASWVVCGDAVDLALGGIFGTLSGKRRAPDYSQIETLVARGDYESARVEYEKVLADHPGHVGVAVKLARMLSKQQQRHNRAVEVIRGALSSGKAKPEQWAYALRVLAEICTVKIRKPGMALPDLRRLVEAHPDTSDAEWARRRIASIRADLAEEGGAAGG